MATCIAELTAAESAADRANRSAAESLSRLVDHYVTQGTRVLESGDTRAAGVWFAEALRLEQGSAARVRNHRRRLAALEASTPRLQWMLQHNNVVRDAEFTPDRSRLVTAANAVARVWDPHTGKALTGPLVHDHYIWETVVSPDSTRFATLSMHVNATSDRQPHVRELRVYGMDGHAAFSPLRLEGLNPYQCLFSPDSSRFVCMVGRDAQVRSVTDGKLIFPPLNHDTPVREVFVSPDGRRLLSRTDERVFAWNLETGESLHEPIPGTTIGFTPDSKTFAVTSPYDWSPDGVGKTSTLQLWDAEAIRPRHAPVETATQIRSSLFVLDGRRLATSFDNDEVGLWEVGDDACTRIDPASLPGHNDRVPMTHVTLRAPVLSPDQRSMALTERDGLRVWNVETGEDRMKHSDSTPRYGVTEFSADGRRLLVVSSDMSARRGHVDLLDLTTRAVWSIVTPSQSHHFAHFGPDGQFITFADPGFVRVWDVSHRGPGTRQFEGLGSDYWFATVDGSGRYIAALAGPHDLGVDKGGVDSGRVDFMDLRTNARVGGSVELPARGDHALFSLDGKRLAVTDRFANLYIIDVAAREIVARPEHGVGGCYQLQWVGSETLVGLLREGPAHQRGTARPRLCRWDAATGERLELAKTIPECTFLTLAPGGERSLQVLESGEHFIAEAGTDRVLVQFPQLSSRPVSASFSSDGQRLVIVDADRAAHMRDAGSGRLIAPLIQDVQWLRFSPSGEYMLIADSWGAQRVFDGRTGEQLTPAFRDVRQQYIRDEPGVAFFGPKEESILLLTRRSGVLEWQLAEQTERQADAWLEEMKLKAGHHVDAVGGYSRLNKGTQRELWQRVKARRHGADW